MNITDPIADLLTRIRNAQHAKHATAEVPVSKLKVAVANLLVREGYLQGVEQVADPGQARFRVVLRYDAQKKGAIRGIERVSKPGRRLYCDARELPRVRQGLGTAILSTSKGVLSDQEARELNVGGEYLCRVW